MARGYRNYRGRTSKGKIALAVLLVFIILAALSALAMQRYIAYDENGTPFFRLSERQTDPAPSAEEAPPVQSPDSSDSLEIIVQEPEEPEAPPVFQIYSLTTAPLTPATWEAARAEMGDAFGGVTVTLKDARGTVYFASQTAAEKAVKTVQGTTEALRTITGDEDLYAIARLSCLPDAFAPYMNNNPMGLKKKSGQMFRSGGTTWLDPGKPASRAYLCGLVREIAELGFDEILLTDTGSPIQGELDTINYGSDPIEGSLSLLWQDLLQTLEPYGVKLSIELPESVISDGQEAASGLVLARAVSCADRIYAVTEPGQAGILSNLVLQAESVTENRVQEFLPELTAPDAGWNGPFLLLPAAE